MKQTLDDSTPPGWPPCMVLKEGGPPLGKFPRGTNPGPEPRPESAPGFPSRRHLALNLDAIMPKTSLATP